MRRFIVPIFAAPDKTYLEFPNYALSLHYQVAFISDGYNLGVAAYLGLALLTAIPTGYLVFGLHGLSRMDGGPGDPLWKPLALTFTASILWPLTWGIMIHDAVLNATRPPEEDRQRPRPQDRNKHRL